MPLFRTMLFFQGRRLLLLLAMFAIPSFAAPSSRMWAIATTTQQQPRPRSQNAPLATILAKSSLSLSLPLHQAKENQAAVPYSQGHYVVQSLRGGGGGRVDDNHPRHRSRKTMTTTTANLQQPQVLPTHWQWWYRHRVHLVLGSFTVAVLYRERHVWQPWMNRERIQHETLQLLQRFQCHDASGPPSSSCNSYLPLMAYGAGMAVWEALGLTTIPVETAAGMVFGWQAFWPSALGKLAGALLAFSIGRTVWHDFVQQRFAASSSSSSNFLALVLRHRAAMGPWATALLMKFSMFPEFLKNVGTAAFFPHVTAGHFVVATMFHGWLFTAVWTVVGMETATEVVQPQQHAVPPVVLRFVIPTVLAFGMGLPPLLMAWWARTLHQKEKVQALLLSQPPQRSSRQRKQQQQEPKRTWRLRDRKD